MVSVIVASSTEVIVPPLLRTVQNTSHTQEKINSLVGNVTLEPRVALFLTHLLNMSIVRC